MYKKMILLVVIILIIGSIGCIKKKDLLKENQQLKADKTEFENQLKTLAAACEQQKVWDKEKYETQYKNNFLNLKLEYEEKLKEILVKKDADNLVITLSEQILFKLGSNKIRKEMFPVLDRIAEEIKKYPGQMILIKGHTCNLPIKNKKFNNNWELSSLRATEVIKYFIEKAKLPEKQFIAIGMGGAGEDPANRKVIIDILSKAMSN